MLADPSTATATYRRTDELLRLRMFEEAAAEARALPPSRGRDLRLAEAEFALGRFPAATEAARRAFPEIGTRGRGARAGRLAAALLPDRGEGLPRPSARRSSASIPPSCAALVRQESVFEPRARSRAGALGLTQLMPATAKSLARSVLRVRYREAFLYDPGVNARLGAAYFSSFSTASAGIPSSPSPPTTAAPRAWPASCGERRAATTTRSSSPTRPTRRATTCAA